MNITPVKNTPSFGMAWDTRSKDLCEEIVTRAVTSVFSKHGTQTDLFGKIGQHFTEKKTLRMADKIGKMFQEQDFLSNAHLRDFFLGNSHATGKVQIAVEDIRTGELVKTLTPKIKAPDDVKSITEIEALKMLKDVLHRSKSYLGALENKRVRNNKQATEVMEQHIRYAKDDAQEWAAKEIAGIRNQAGRYIAENTADAHNSRAATRITGNRSGKK